MTGSGQFLTNRGLCVKDGVLKTKSSFGLARYVWQRSLAGTANGVDHARPAESAHQAGGDRASFTDHPRRFRQKTARAPVENASIYIKYIEERKVKKDKTGRAEREDESRRDGAHPGCPDGQGAGPFRVADR